MAMLQVLCKDCGSENHLRGWIDKEDLIGTKYEYLINSITEKDLDELEQKGEIKDEWDRWEENPVCPDCGSKNVVSY